jgi:hypothetical protein
VHTNFAPRLFNGLGELPVDVARTECYRNWLRVCRAIIGPQAEVGKPDRFRKLPTVILREEQLESMPGIALALFDYSLKLLERHHTENAKALLRMSLLVDAPETTWR